jgi:O-antigen/teichoic acid export membrane protein
MSGIVWKFAERFVAQGVTFVVSLVLARILMPSDYGVVSIINIFITIADVFLSSGLNTALIQKKDADELDFSTIFWCNLGLGLLIYCILFVAAPFMAIAYNMPILTSAVRVFALRLPISSFQSIQTAYVSRKMDFKKFFFATITGTLISAAVGIIMALKGFGVWSLIAQYMTNTVIDTLFLFATVKWIPKKMFSWNAAKPLIRYGSKVMLTDLIGTVFNNLGDFIIGLKYSSANLAYYTKGKQLPTLLRSNIYTSLISVLFPGMSKVNDMNDQVKIISKRSIETLSYIIFPIMTGLFVVAEPLTLLLYTEKWLPIVPYVRIICIEAILSVPGTITLQAVKAIGRSDMMLKSEFIKKPILLASILIALRYGVLAIALILPINTFIEFVINGIMVKRTINYRLSEQLKDCSSALIMSAIMGISIYFIAYLKIHAYLILLIQVILGIAVYVILSAITKNKSFTAIKNIFAAKIHH